MAGRARAELPKTKGCLAWHRNRGAYFSASSVTKVTPHAQVTLASACPENGTDNGLNTWWIGFAVKVAMLYQRGGEVSQGRTGRVFIETEQPSIAIHGPIMAGCF